jgi:hypothetical protein
MIGMVSDAATLYHLCFDPIPPVRVLMLYKTRATPSCEPMQSIKNSFAPTDFAIPFFDRQLARNSISFMLNRLLRIIVYNGSCKVKSRTA